MALNLNKGGEENSKPDSGKKNINLSKSNDTAKAHLNLDKDEFASKESAPTVSEANDRMPKKKNPVVLLLIAVLLAGGGIFWLFTSGKKIQEPESNLQGDTAVSTLPAQIDGSASPENSNNKGQSNAASSSPVTSPGNSESNAPRNVVPSSSNNTSATNNVESDKPTSNKNQSVTSTSVQSAVTPVGTIDEKVNQVMRGVFGNGSERKRALGEEYLVIQSKVNELYQNKNQ
jgi:hypothetical protein